MVANSVAVYGSESIATKLSFDSDGAFVDAESIAEMATVAETVNDIPLEEKGPRKSDPLEGSDNANTPPLESKLEKEVESTTDRKSTRLNSSHWE